jgi:GT2 family glycosyltransferase
MASISSDVRSPVEPTISIVIPVHNGGESFRECLASLAKFVPPSTEIVIVVDGGMDDSWRLAEESGARVIKFPTAGGPARARNAGAQVAQSDILFFIDADVTIEPDTLKQVAIAFQTYPDLTALIGSYDDAPGAPNFLSQYKNLFHHYTHQTGCEEASTFWGACGAIKREVFLEIGGFDEAYRYPSIEDIELGYRLKRSGHQIRLCKEVQVKHLKCWRPVSLLRAEFFHRALPWTELLWRDRQFVNDLNLKTSSRVSLALTYGLLAALVSSWWWAPALIFAGILSLSLLMLNFPVYQFFQRKRGLWFAVQTIPWHWLYFLYSGLAFATGTIRYHVCQYRTAKTRLSQV